jgi:hypothetical protein
MSFLDFSLSKTRLLWIDIPRRDFEISVLARLLRLVLGSAVFALFVVRVWSKSFGFRAAILL